MEPATSVEHVPAKCFFPKGHRVNLITVPSCSVHNNDTAKDDEYVRGILVCSSRNNQVALGHWKGDVRRTFMHSPKLFLKTFKTQIGNSFFHDRQRIDNLMIKIAYGVYFHTYKMCWHSYPSPYYKQFFDEYGKTDIELRLPNHSSLPEWHIYVGENQSFFKYQFFDGTVNGKTDCILRMVFYGGFEVIIVPHDEKVNLPYDCQSGEPK
ncbi:hypothetical protein [Pedobacter miscanthi]|uniref:hypothetical protein n=1 Tax=Pedobacter miscanthi TaxID=2259170 RepID=UPI00292E0568|nr:hypothetical protein [Pedobacter miscanthi]